MALKEGKVWRCGLAQSYQSEVYCFDSLLVEGLRHIPTPPIVFLRILPFYFLLPIKAGQLSPKSEVTDCLEHSVEFQILNYNIIPFAAVS